MKAAMLQSPRTLEWVELPRPEPAPGQALVRVRAVGICGSDVHAFHGTSAFQVYPGIPGHEVAGEVAALGPDAGSLRVGDHVVLDPMIRCGHCFSCRSGRYNCCTSLQVMGVHTNGGFVEYLAVEAERLHPISPDILFELAAMVEPLCIGAQSVSRGRVSAEDRVLVIGAGTIGLAALVMAKQQGAAVASADLLPAKLAVAAGLGADLTVNPAEQDLAQAVLDWTGGDGASVVIEAVGSPRTTRAALDYVSSAGRVVIVGITPQEVPFPIPLLVRKELDILASRNSREQFPRVIGLVESGKVDPRPLVSHFLPFERVEEGFRLIEENPDEARKVVLVFD